MNDAPTPRTEEVLRKNAASELTPEEDYEALAVHAEQLERELAAKDAHADEIYKAAVDLAAKLEADLEQERQDRKQAEADICRALGERNDARAQLGSPTDPPDANTTAHARINWWKQRCDDLNEQLAAERALADRLAGELQWWGDYCGDSAPASIDLALAAWKASRDQQEGGAE